MSNKGQALLEFVLILPVFLLILFAIIDFGRIIYEQNRLENIISDAVDLVNNNELSTKEIEKKLEDDYQLPLTLTINRTPTDINIRLKRTIDVITPGLGIAISDPYQVEVKRVINNE